MKHLRQVQTELPAQMSKQKHQLTVLWCYLSCMWRVKIFCLLA